MRVTVNTDDYAIFGTSLSDEYLRLFQTGLLTASELETVRQNGLKENREMFLGLNE
jgi:adenosine deaminase